MRLLSFDAAMKYRGIFLQTEVFQRWIDGMDADGPLPVAQIADKGFYIQGAFYPIKKKLELYGATSWVYGDTDAGLQQQPRVPGGGEHLLVQLQERPHEHPDHAGAPLAGEQHVRLLRRRPEGPDRLRGDVAPLLSMSPVTVFFTIAA